MPDPAAPRAKVLFVLPNFAGGGAERVALTLLAGLDRGAFVPQLAVLEGTGPLRPLLTGDVTLHELGRPRLRRALPALVGLIRRERPAVVFATQGYLNLALLAARPLLPAGTRLALRESNTPSQSLPNRGHPRLMAWAYRWLYPRSDLLFCQHRRTAQEMRTVFAVPIDRLADLPNPVPESTLRAAAAKPLRQPGSGVRFVAAGRLNRQKGFDRLIELFAAMPGDARLTVYGEGGEATILQNRIDALGLQDRITLAGFTEALPAALAGADACLVASRWEGLPNVALESLAVGTPVIATEDSGGIAELAEAAVPGAVTIAPWGDDFLARLAACAPQPSDTLRPSLLPARYTAENVAATFNRHLLKLAGKANVGYEGPL